VLVIKLGTTNSSPKCHCESVLEAVFRRGFSQEMVLLGGIKQKVF